MADINLDDLRAAINRMANDMSAASEAARDLANAEKSAADAKAELEAKQKMMWESTKKGFTDLHSSLTSTSGGMSKYSSTVSNFGGLLSETAKQFGPLGKAIGHTIDAVAALTNMVLKQNDAILGSFKSLREFGSTMAFSTDQVLALGTKAGFTSQNLDSFYKSTKIVGQGLTTLGMTTSEGIKNFSELASTTEAQRKAFRNLGYEQEAFTEAQAIYINQLALTGGTLAKAPKQLGEESRKYVEQLTLLAELTGTSVKEQQKALEIAQANENFNAYLFSLEQDRAQAVKDNNKAEIDRLDQQLNSTRALGAHIVATNDAAVAAAKLEAISNKTGIIYTDNNAHLLMNGQNYQNLNDMLKNGAKAEEIILEEMNMNAKAVKNYNQTLNETAFSLGKASRENAATFGISNKNREAALSYARFQNMNEEERKKFLADQLKNLETAKNADESRLGLENARQESELKYREAMDKLALLVAGPLNTALTKLVTLTTSLIEGFSKVLDFFGGKSTPTPTEGVSGSSMEAEGFGAPAESSSAGAAPSSNRAPMASGPVGSPGTVTKNNPIAEVVSVGSGFNIVQRPDGKKEKLEGPRNWRNNNPGNIEFGGFAQKYGAIGSDGRFAIFPSYEAGRAAKAALIFEGKNYSGLDLQRAIYRYAPPSENDSEQYFKSILSAAGGKNKKMAEYTNSERESILTAMERMEGFKVGKVTSISARSGGLASGPSTGYPATLHGSEAIIPLDPTSLITKLMKTPESEIAREMGASSMNNNIGELIAVMTEKLDDVIYALKSSNNTQEELLRYSRN